MMYDPSSMPVLQKGSKGSAVQFLQNKLMELGYELPRFGADADYGNETISMLMKFQQLNKLPVTGITNKATWVKLLTGNPVRLSQAAETVYSTTSPGKIMLPGNLMAKLKDPKILTGLGIVVLGIAAAVLTIKKRKVS